MTRRIPQDEMVFVVTSMTSKPAIVANRKVMPGHSVEIPARYVVGDLKRCQSMSHLQITGKISVGLKFSTSGLVAAAVDPTYMLSLQAATAGPMGMPPVYPNASRPVNADVPQGFQLYDGTNDKPNYNDGAAWVDGTGAPA